MSAVTRTAPALAILLALLVAEPASAQIDTSTDEGQIAQNLRNGGAWTGLTWSPDSRRLVVSDGSGPGSPQGLVQLDVTSGSREPIVSPPPGSSSVHQPALSPDGRTVAFKAGDGESARLMLVDVAGGEPRELAPTHALGKLAWLPGSEALLFSAVPRRHGDSLQPSGSTSGDQVLWRVPVAGGMPEPVPGPTGSAGVSLSAGGDRLVYEQMSLQGDIWRVELGSREEEAVTSRRLIASTRLDSNPAYSPDGQRIAFSSGRSGAYEIWVGDAQGDSLLRLTSLGEDGMVASPRWSGDGVNIAFDHTARNRENEGESSNADIYVARATGGGERRVTSHPAEDHTPSWSSDGSWIYFSSNRTGSGPNPIDDWQVWKIAASGGEATARQVTRGGGFRPIESADGEYVYFVRRGSQPPALCRVRPDGGDEEVVIERLASSWSNWDLGAEGIYYLDRSMEAQRAWVVMFLAFESDSPVQLAELEHTPYFGGPAFSVSPDGRWLLSADFRLEFDLMVVEDFR